MGKHISKRYLREMNGYSNQITIPKKILDLWQVNRDTHIVELLVDNVSKEIKIKFVEKDYFDTDTELAGVSLAGCRP